jgi:hypothetical protein
VPEDGLGGLNNVKNKGGGSRELLKVPCSGVI